MKKILSVLFALSAVSAWAEGSCESIVRWAVFSDAANLYCKEGCNVGDVLSAVTRKSGKAGAVTSAIALRSNDGRSQVYDVSIDYTDARKNIRRVSNYEITTDANCWLQGMTRKP